MVIFSFVSTVTLILSLVNGWWLFSNGRSGVMWIRSCDHLFLPADSCAMPSCKSVYCGIKRAFLVKEISMRSESVINIFLFLKNLYIHIKYNQSHKQNYCYQCLLSSKPCVCVSVWYHFICWLGKSFLMCHKTRLESSLFHLVKREKLTVIVISVQNPTTQFNPIVDSP